MSVSVFDLFKIGVGPSSSHTVGPMLAANIFVESIENISIANRVRVDLYGSLAETGLGHCTNVAVLIGLEGACPSCLDPDAVSDQIMTIRQNSRIRLNGLHSIEFNETNDLIFHYGCTFPRHPNALSFTLYDTYGDVIKFGLYYSVGGGFVVQDDMPPLLQSIYVEPLPFDSGAELLAQCKRVGLSISEVMLENEKARAGEQLISTRLLEIWTVMNCCINRGLKGRGILPGGLKVPRRAGRLFSKLSASDVIESSASLRMSWVNLYAMAVSEENACGGRVVTAPTNGASGIIPAVLRYYIDFVDSSSEEGIVKFLLAAGAIGKLYKLNASLSGADVGCQGEIGVACSMAAAGFAEVLGGSPEQVENAAEIGMEHNLGLTCDPVGGLVQIPCIERNAMGAVKAINAALIALDGTGEHVVSLDQVIATMKQTGQDMNSNYKETSKAGLAVNVIEC